MGVLEGMSRQRRKDLCRKIKLRADAEQAFQRSLLRGVPFGRAALACSWGDPATRFGRHWYDSKPWWRRLIWKLRWIQLWQWLRWQWLKLRRKVAEFRYSDEFHFAVDKET
jgi:hypothetical protein